MRRKVYRILGTAVAAGLWLGAPGAAFAAGPPPATLIAAQASVPVEAGGLINFVKHLYHDIVGGGTPKTTEADIASMPITSHNHVYSLKAVTNQKLPVMQAEVAGLTGASNFMTGAVGNTHNLNQTNNQRPSGSGATSTTQTWVSGVPVTTTVQTVNPNQVLGGSGILTSFNGSGIPGQQLLNNGFHNVNMLFSSTNTGVAGGQVTASSIASTLPPNTQRLFAKTLLIVAENNNHPSLTARIDDNQWVQTFESLHPGIPISMVGQPMWGQTNPPLYNVAPSPAYDLSWSSSQLAILHQDNALNTPMPGALKVTLTYVMGYNGQWQLRQVFLHFWPDGNAMPKPPKKSPGCTVNCVPVPQQVAVPKTQGVTSGLTDNAAMTDLANQGQINSLQGSFLGSSSGSGGSVVITLGGKNYQLGPNLMSEMASALAANLRFVFPTYGNGTASLIQAENNGLTANVGVSTGVPSGLGLSAGTSQSGSFDAYIGVGTGLAPGIGQQLVQETVTRSHPSVVKQYVHKKA